MKEEEVGCGGNEEEDDKYPGFGKEEEEEDLSRTIQMGPVGDKVLNYGNKEENKD